MLDSSLRLQPALRSNAGIITEHPRSNQNRTVEASIRENCKSCTDYRDAKATNTMHSDGPSTTDVLLPICAEEFNCNDRSRTDTCDLDMRSTSQSDAEIGNKDLFQNIPYGTSEGAFLVQGG